MSKIEELPGAWERTAAGSSGWVRETLLMCARELRAALAPRLVCAKHGFVVPRMNISLGAPGLGYRTIPSCPQCGRWVD